MAKRKKLEKKARKAYERAEEAIQEALKAAAKLDKKTKKKAASLSDEWAKAGGSSGPGKGPDDAHRRRDDSDGGVATSDGRTAAIDLTPPLPSVTDENAETAAEFAGSVATTAPHDPALDSLTVQALRDVAKSRGYRNVSRLTKAQLIERLSD
ncbi:Rho termination factor N-terminal domain-containing protein [Leifsonia sp. AG29]|uniref:Rho termination factor N-terminal domain-containing protein n=1 Tax=Leifsonia sp. AG29 TaxID=2598860 RepID=UPI00131E22CB|nr:Rho termination factor N-terminal domain-containing protein [Leifsonia sp. AG29]